MTEVIRKIFTKTEAGEEEAVISVDAGLVIAIGDGRQLTLRTMIDRSLTVERQKDVLRGLLDLADEPKARYELRDFEHEAMLKRRVIAKTKEEMGDIASKNVKERAALEVELDSLKEILLELPEKQERAFRASGRLGRFRPSEQEDREKLALERDIAKVEERLQAIGQNEETERSQKIIAMQRDKDDLRAIEDEIAKRKRILGLPVEE